MIQDEQRQAPKEIYISENTECKAGYHVGYHSSSGGVKYIRFDDYDGVKVRAHRFEEDSYGIVIESEFERAVGLRCGVYYMLW